MGTSQVRHVSLKQNNLFRLQNVNDHFHCIWEFVNINKACIMVRSICRILPLMVISRQKNLAKSMCMHWVLDIFNPTEYLYGNHGNSLHWKKTILPMSSCIANLSFTTLLFFHRSHRFSSKSIDLKGFFFYNCVNRFAAQNRDNVYSKCSKLYHYHNNCLFSIVLLTTFLTAYIEILPFKNYIPIPSTVSSVGPHISPKIFYDHCVY